MLKSEMYRYAAMAVMTDAELCLEKEEKVDIIAELMDRAQLERSFEGMKEKEEEMK